MSDVCFVCLPACLLETAFYVHTNLEKKQEKKTHSHEYLFSIVIFVEKKKHLVSVFLIYAYLLIGPLHDDKHLHTLVNLYTHW